MKVENDKLESIIRKIRGLIAVAEDNSNEEEAQSAFVMAQKMMMKYNIEQSQITDKGDDVSIIAGQGSAYKRVFWYEKTVFNIVCTNFRVKGYYNHKHVDGSRKRKTAVMFYGLESDVKIAKEMYILALDALEHYTKKYIDEMYKDKEVRFKSYTSELKNSYIRGFVDGLREKLNEQRNQLQQEFGLIVLTPKVVEDAYLELSKDFGKAKKLVVPRADITEAYSQGYKDGNVVDYTKSTLDDMEF